MRSFIIIMPIGREYINMDFGIVNLVDHAILFVDTTRPRLFKDLVLQVLHLASACTGMLLKFQKHICDFLDSGFVTTLFDGGNLFLGLFRKQYGVSHFLQRIDKFGDVFFAFKTREFGSRLDEPWQYLPRQLSHYESRQRKDRPKDLSHKDRHGTKASQGY